eukprot:CAMPEP_0197672580 /NCGR_PEP_ID=MMETSP1338-20131121/79262_1 /TAXON_ID=43686 ORGANISM="Pelagodinium beii, Strain RCC1491" /NCGR_SAMPLE_ID=MMETSP1338 /ASSEMBLY_ACC=CAM_ASM_000754 /LENGTH=198 /DNA_ID=CAMNT_0043252707 /DNA_START=487 /DNA_END=1083 /DNA_ORIENTATION=+
MVDGTSQYAWGTVTPSGIEALTSYLQIDSNDVFTDLGSGIGNVIAQMHCNTRLKTVRGIEFVTSRHLAAQANLETLKRRGLLDPNRKILLVNGDVQEEDFSDSTVVLASCASWTDAILSSVQKLCEANQKLKYLITTQKLKNTSLRLLGEVWDMETSWSGCLSPYQIYSNIQSVRLQRPPVVSLLDPRACRSSLAGEV